MRSTRWEAMRACVPGANASYTYDSSGPVPSHEVVTYGGTLSRGIDFLGAGDTLGVIALFSEVIGATNPVLQFKDGENNLGGAVTATTHPSFVYTNTVATGDTGNTDDPVDFGDPASGSGVVREALGNGYVYKTTQSVPFLTIAAYAKQSANATFKARYHTSKPTTSNMATVGTELWSGNNRGSVHSFAVDETKVLTNAAAGTYFWFYPSTSSSMTDRTIAVYGSSVPGLMEYNNGNHSHQVLAGPSKPITFGAVPNSFEGVVQESLGSGYVYKVTEPFHFLQVFTGARFNGGSALRARWATSKPTTDNMKTFGTQAFDVNSWRVEVPCGGNTCHFYDANGVVVLTNVAVGTYFWFYPTGTDRWTSQRVFELTGIRNYGDNIYAAARTVGSTENVDEGDLSYEYANAALVTDALGNPMAATAAAVADTVIDTTAPKVSSVSYSGSTLVVTMDDAVYSATKPDTTNFTLTRSGGGAPTVSSVTGFADLGGGRCRHIRADAQCRRGSRRHACLHAERDGC